MRTTAAIIKVIKPIRYILLCLSLLVGSVNFVSAQSKSNEGNEFLIGFMSHIDGTIAGMSLYITGDSNTSGTVSIPGQNWSTSFTVTANSITVVNVDVSKAYISCSDCIVSKGVKVEADKKVVVYAHHYQGARSDATLVLPTRTLGKEYYVMTYQEAVGSGRSQFAVVASKDSTLVNITPSVDISKSTGGTRSAGTTFQIVLDADEVYQGIASSNTGDLTGTHIQVIDTGSTANCRTVAVFSGSSFTRITSNCSFGGTADNLLEQLYPTTSWGNQFVLVPALGRSSDNFRIIAKENSTQIVVYNSAGAPDVININKGEYADLLSQNTVRYAVANKPILVAQFQKTAGCDGGGNFTGDPSMTILNPLEQTLKKVTLYSSEYFNIDNHYINIVIPAYAASSFTVDGASASFTSVPRNSQYSYARIQVSKGNHRLKADAGFIATAYGEGRVESYGYAAGANVIDLTAQAKVANSTKNGEVTNCIGRPTNFTGQAEYTVVRWEWDFGDGITDTVQNPTHLYLDTGIYVAKLYTYKPAFDGCSNYDSAFVEVKIFGKPEARMSKTNLCDSLTAIFTDESVMPSPETKLINIWNIQGASGVKYGSLISHLFDTTGKFEVRMEVVTTNQCKDTLLDSLVVNPTPKADFTFSDACFYDSSNFINQSSIISGRIDTNRWMYSDLSGSLDESPIHFFSDSGSYQITLAVVSESGCKDTMTKELYKHPRMDVSFSYYDTCFGEGNSFLNTSILEGGTYTDTTWYTSVPDTASTYNFTSTFGSIGTFKVTLIMEQDSFCRDTFTQDVDVDPLPIPAFTFAGLCLSDSTLFLDATTLSSGTYTVAWNFGNGTTGVGSPTKIQYLTNGQKTVTLTATSDLGCAADTTLSILITNPDIVNINTSDLCEGYSQEMSSTNSLGLDSFSAYAWTVNGTSIGTDSTVSYTANSAGIYRVNLEVMTKNGCSISLLDSFESFVSPSANFTVSDVCDGENILPTDNSTIQVPAFISGYQWLVDGVSRSTKQYPTLSTSGEGLYRIKLITTSGNGCVDSIQKVDTIYPVPNTSFTTSNQCFGKNTLLTNSSTLTSGNVSNLQWTVDGVNYTGSGVSYVFPSYGNHEIRLISESDKGCLDTLTRDVAIHPLPVLDVQIDSDSGCIPFDAAIVNNSTIPSGAISAITYTWGDGTVNQANTHTYTVPGTYPISAVAESDQGCRDSVGISKVVRVFDLPTADFVFTPLKPSTLTELVTFKDMSVGNPVQWDWSTSDGFFYSGSSVGHQFADSGLYRVTLSIVNDKGCEDETYQDVYVNADLLVHIPNGFSPNGDGINDTYGLGGITQGVNKLQMTIYNRWGEIIFSSTNVADRWDGTYQGKPVPQGVYLYMIQYTNPKQTKWYYLNGEIHLMK